MASDITLRRRVWQVLDANGADGLSKVIDTFLVALIFANVIAIILESVPSIFAVQKGLFNSFEIFSVTIFSIEYIARVWSSVEEPEAAGRPRLRSRLRYASSPMALIDLIAILPFFLSSLFPALDLRFLRVLRMLRIFKLTRYSPAVSILLQVLRQERQSFGAAIFILMMVTVIASSGIYMVEHTHQPEAFGSIPAAMWWAMATLTTVGYGDVTPITPFGKVFGGLIAIVGIGMVALPSGILASGFSDVLRQREREYERQLAKTLEDGVITPQERAQLDRLREHLNLSEESAHSLQFEAGAFSKLTHCPHCGEVLQDEGEELT